MDISILDGGDATIYLNDVLVAEMTPDFEAEAYVWVVLSHEGKILARGHVPFGELGTEVDKIQAVSAYEAMIRAAKELLTCPS